MKKILYIVILLSVSICTMAQKAEKIMEKEVFEAMDSKVQGDIDGSMDKAKAAFEKILSKTPEDAMANLGLSVVYGYDTYTGKDYFKAWQYFQVAEKKQSEFTQEQLEVLNIYFSKVDMKRRNRPIDKNMEWAREYVEDNLIKYVREENNIEYAERFISEFPDSRYYENVRHIRNYIEYRLAEDANSIEAYDSFLKKYPESAQVQVATRKRNALAFKNANAANSLAALQKFVTSYPDAVQVEEAKKLMGVLAFDEAAKKRTIDAVDAFMISYPNSPKMPEAKILKKQLLFERAKSVNTIEAFNEFVALYPEGEMYIDIFNLKSNAMGQKILMDFPMENYAFVKGFDNRQFDDYGGDIALRTDESILLVTNTINANTKNYDTWLLDLKADGKMNWTKVLGNPLNDQANKMKISATNEIYVAGKTNAQGDNIPGQAWLYKLDAKGDNIYNRKLEGAEVLALDIFDNGDAIIGGYTLGADTAKNATLLTKVNAKGNKMWSRTYTFGTKIFDIATQAGTAYIAAGNGVFAIDSKGYLLWDSQLENVNATSVGLAGELVVFGANTPEGSVAIAFDKTGTEKWRTTLPAGTNGYMTNVNELPGGITLLAGTYDNKVFFIKVNSSGEVTDNKTFETAKGLKLNGIAVKGNQVLTSVTLGNTSRDIIVFKMSF